MKKSKNIFIEGFRDPTPIQPHSDIILVDLRADGDSKLILFDTKLNSMIIYKGVNRQFQKSIELNNVSGMISYYDQNSRSPQPNIAFASENGFYIYRGLKESFRLRVPNLEPDPEEQLLWSQYEDQPEKLNQQLMKLGQNKRLTETARYLIGSNSIERKKELINKAFTSGLIEKDCICAMSVIKPQQETSPGNVVLCTELKKMLILDTYGHSIIKYYDIEISAHQVFAFGETDKQYMIVVISRQYRVLIYINGNIVPKSFDLEQKVLNAVFEFPTLYVLTINKAVLVYELDKEPRKKYSMKFSTQPVQVEFLKTKYIKALIVGFQKEIRIYNQKALVCVLGLKQKLFRMKFGTFGRQQGCLVIIYQDKGYEVRIIHRQFDIKQKLEKVENQDKILDTNLPIPKKTNIFVSEIGLEVQNGINMYKGYQKDMRLLRWRVLKEQIKNYDKTDSKIKLNSNVMGLGPNFILRLELENLTEQPLMNVNIFLNYNSSVYQIQQQPNSLLLMVPHFVYPVEIKVRNISQKGQSDYLRVSVTGEKSDQVSITVQMPACEILQ